MKKAIACLLALPLLLAACGAPAADTAGQPTTETAQTTETAPEPAAPVGVTGRLRSIDQMMATEDGLYSVTAKDDGETNRNIFCLLKTDYDTAVQEKMTEITLQCGIFYGMAAWNDTVELYMAENIDTNNPTQLRYIVNITTGNVECRPIEDSFWPAWYDDSALYQLDYGTYNRIIRLDRATSEVSYIQLPEQTQAAYGVGERWLIQRVVSPSPLPDPIDGDMYSAVLQNSEMELDSFDPATGAMEKIFTYPTEGEEYYYYGQRDGTLYFCYYATDEKGNPASPVVKKLENGEMLQVLTVENEYDSIRGLADENGELQWLCQDEISALEMLNLETGQTSQPAAEMHEYVTRGYPYMLLPGGKVLVNYDSLDIPGLWDTVAYALIDRTAYLSGSTDYTPITMYTGA